MKRVALVCALLCAALFAGAAASDSGDAPLTDVLRANVVSV